MLNILCLTSSGTSTVTRQPFINELSETHQRVFMYISLMWSVSNLNNVQFSSDVPTQQSFSFPGNPVAIIFITLKPLLVSLFYTHKVTSTTLFQFLGLTLKAVDNNYIKRPLLKQRSTFLHWNVDNSVPKNAIEISK